jgi:hypothetical protein
MSDLQHCKCPRAPSQHLPNCPSKKTITVKMKTKNVYIASPFDEEFGGYSLGVAL